MIGTSPTAYIGVRALIYFISAIPILAWCILFTAKSWIWYIALAECIYFVIDRTHTIRKGRKSAKQMERKEIDVLFAKCISKSYVTVRQVLSQLLGFDKVDRESTQLVTRDIFACESLI